MLEIQEEFKVRLEKALAIRGMKAIDLVNKTGISESAISQYRKGLTKPKRNRLVEIANALSVNPSWLLGLDVPMEMPDSKKMTSISSDVDIVIDADYIVSVENKSNANRRIIAYAKGLNQLIRYISMLNEQGIEELTKHAKLMSNSEDYRKDDKT